MPSVASEAPAVLPSRLQSAQRPHHPDADSQRTATPVRRPARQRRPRRPTAAAARAGPRRPPGAAGPHRLSRRPRTTAMPTPSRARRQRRRQPGRQGSDASKRRARTPRTPRTRNDAETAKDAKDGKAVADDGRRRQGRKTDADKPTSPSTPTLVPCRCRDAGRRPPSQAAVARYASRSSLAAAKTEAGAPEAGCARRMQAAGQGQRVAPDAAPKPGQAARRQAGRRSAKGARRRRLRRPRCPQIEAGKDGQARGNGDKAPGEFHHAAAELLAKLDTDAPAPTGGDAARPAKAGADAVQNARRARRPANATVQRPPLAAAAAGPGAGAGRRGAARRPRRRDRDPGPRRQEPLRDPPRSAGARPHRRQARRRPRRQRHARGSWSTAPTRSTCCKRDASTLERALQQAGLKTSDNGLRILAAPAGFRTRRQHGRANRARASSCRTTIRRRSKRCGKATAGCSAWAAASTSECKDPSWRPAASSQPPRRSVTSAITVADRLGDLDTPARPGIDSNTHRRQLPDLPDAADDAAQEPEPARSARHQPVHPQLVQFAQVEQQLKSNDQLSTLVSLQQTAQNTAALELRRPDGRRRRQHRRAHQRPGDLESERAEARHRHDHDHQRDRPDRLHRQPTR